MFKNPVRPQEAAKPTSENLIYKYSKSMQTDVKIIFLGMK